MASPAALVVSSPASGLSSNETVMQRQITAAMVLAGSAARRDGVGAASSTGILIVEDFGPGTFRAVLKRQMDPRSRLLLCVTGGLACPNWLTKLAIRAADLVVVADDDALNTILRLSPSGSRVFAIPEADRNGLDPFLRCPAHRAGEDAHRIVFSDELAPHTGAADFLLAAMAWANRNQGRLVEIVWIGEGVLKEILRAQPAPHNLSQRFIPPLPTAEVVDLFAQSGILAAPTAYGRAGHPVLQALAAGLPVLGSIRCGSARQWVRQAETGWVSDPLQPGSIFDSLSLALATSVEDLDHMRRIARADVEAAAAPTVLRRVRHAIGILLDSGDRNRTRLWAES